MQIHSRNVWKRINYVQNIVLPFLMKAHMWSFLASTSITINNALIWTDSNKFSLNLTLNHN